VIANYSVGDEAWLLKWYQLLISVPPADRDFLIADIKFTDAGPQWQAHQMSSETVDAFFNKVMHKAAEAVVDKYPESTHEDAKKWAVQATKHWFRSIVPAMGGQRKHEDRAVRFQGGWSQNSPMPDHYTRTKRAISLGMVGSLVKDLKGGWRPGIDVDHTLIQSKGAEAIRDAKEVMPASDSEDELGAAAAAFIGFYFIPSAKTDETGAARSQSGLPLVAHVPGMEDPDRPACRRLINEGKLISEMVEMGCWPRRETQICKFCRDARPEIIEQLAKDTAFVSDAIKPKRKAK
jgi:hypothetical protein